MTATIQPESKPTSRRAVLVGALGGLGAWAASAIGRPSPARAGTDGDVVLGAANTATTQTGITNFDNNSTVLLVESAIDLGNGGGIAVTGVSTSSIGLYGTSSSSSGVYGNSSSGTGVYGTSDSGAGVWGTSSTSVGVRGFSDATDQPASLGLSRGNSTGLQGVSGLSQPAAPAKTGVYGYAAQDAASVGVRGESSAGFGVYGKTTGTGFAGYFNGKTFMSQFVEIAEMTTPASPGSNRARVFVRHNGQGKTQLAVKFANGSVKVLATET